jgi:hypothetical protein
MFDLFNGLSFYAVQFDQQSLSLNNWWFGTGCNAQYELLSDSALRLTSAGVKKLYKRLDTVPESLELKPAPLGKKNDLSAERMREIRTEYSTRMVNDQMVRMNGIEHIVAAKMNRTDADNTAALKKLIAEVGWLDVERFGEQASAAAILIVLHSGDIPLMAAALPRIEVDAAAQRIDGGLYAKLYDRLALNLGRKQRFGTQHTVLLVNGVVAGKKKTQPIEDVAKVDQYRAEVGLPPLPADEKNQ